MFPNVDLLDDKIITHYDRLYTSGGAYSFTSLMIYLIEKYFGHEAAVLLSKIFLVHLHDATQSTFCILNLQKGHNNPDIRKVQDYLENNYPKTVTIDKMAEIACMSPRTFMRNFKKHTGNTPNKYLQKVRVENAKKMLEHSGLSIEQICMEVGYIDFAAFRKIFKKYAGLTPSNYKRQYGKTFLPAIVGSLAIC